MTHFKLPLARSNVLAALASAALSACYVVPLSPDGYPYQPYGGAIPPAPVTTPAAPTSHALQARLYPMNDRATQSGVLNGTVTTSTVGSGRFQLNYRGETLSGEATRVDGDARRGVASAYGSSGAFMSCEYQMMSARQGAGSCTISDGAKYQVHIGP